MILIIFSLLLPFTGTFWVFLEYRLFFFFYFISRKVSLLYILIHFLSHYWILYFGMIICLRLSCLLFFPFLPICSRLFSSLFEAIGLFLSVPSVIMFSYICNCFQLCLLYSDVPPWGVMVGDWFSCICNLHFHLSLSLYHLVCGLVDVLCKPTETRCTVSLLPGEFSSMLCFCEVWGYL